MVSQGVSTHDTGIEQFLTELDAFQHLPRSRMKRLQHDRERGRFYDSEGRRVVPEFVGYEVIMIDDPHKGIWGTEIERNIRKIGYETHADAFSIVDIIKTGNTLSLGIVYMCRQ